MDQARTNFNYSTKNIPIHSRKEHKTALLHSFQKLAHRLSWKAWFFLNPNENPSRKETFGLTSTASAPFVPELQTFYNKMIDMMRDVEYRNFSNPLQTELKNDKLKTLHQSGRNSSPERASRSSGETRGLSFFLASDALAGLVGGESAGSCPSPVFVPSPSSGQCDSVATPPPALSNRGDTAEKGKRPR